MPVTSTSVSRTATAAIATCVQRSTFRLSKRSAIAPPHTPKSNVGRNWSAMASPTRNPLLCERCSTSQLRAIVCIHVPPCEMSWPVKNRRKFRTCIDWKVPRSVFTSPPSWPVVLQALEQRQRAREEGALGVGELGDAPREVGVLARAEARQQLTAGVGDRGTRDAAVGGVDHAGDIAPLLEPGDDAGHARRLHLLDRSELPEGDRTEPLDGRQRALGGRG